MAEKRKFSVFFLSLVLTSENENAIIIRVTERRGVRAVYGAGLENQ